MTEVTQAPINRQNVVDDLVLLADVVGSLKAHGIIALGADGHYAFVDAGLAADAAEAADVMKMLTARGIAVPEKVQRIVQALPALLPFLASA